MSNLLWLALPLCLYILNEIFDERKKVQNILSCYIIRPSRIWGLPYRPREDILFLKPHLIDCIIKETRRDRHHLISLLFSHKKSYLRDFIQEQETFITANLLVERELSRSKFSLEEEYFQRCYPPSS